MEPQKTELLIDPAMEMRNAMAALRERAEEHRRAARIAERTAIFLGAWMNSGLFRVPVADAADIIIHPVYPRQGGPMAAYYNARSDAEYWARQMEAR